MGGKRAMWNGSGSFRRRRFAVGYQGLRCRGAVVSCDRRHRLPLPLLSPR